MSGSPLPAPLGEGLFSSATIRLFGRPFTGLVLGDEGWDSDLDGEPKPVDPPTNPPGYLARIYGFSYQNNYYSLSAPAVFLLKTPGRDVAPGFEQKLGIVGLDYKEGTFSKCLKMWAVNELDVGVRIDISVGWLTDILLSREINPDNGDSGSGSGLVGRDGSMVGRDGSMIGPARRRF